MNGRRARERRKTQPTRSSSTLRREALNQLLELRLCQRLDWVQRQMRARPDGDGKHRRRKLTAAQRERAVELACLNRAERRRLLHERSNAGPPTLSPTVRTRRR